MITVREFYTTLMDEYCDEKLTQEEFDKIADSGIVPRGLVEAVLDTLKSDIKSYEGCYDEEYTRGVCSACQFYTTYIEDLLKKFEEEEEKND